MAPTLVFNFLMVYKNLQNRLSNAKTRHLKPEKCYVMIAICVSMKPWIIQSIVGFNLDISFWFSPYEKCIFYFYRKYYMMDYLYIFWENLAMQKHSPLIASSSLFFLHFAILKWWKYYNKGNKLVITVGYYLTNIEDKVIVIKLPLFKLRKVWIAGGVTEIIVYIEKFFDTSTCDGFTVD